jgi:Ca2+-binding RTX toxin-like protein
MIIGILGIETINGDAMNDILHGGIGGDQILSRTDNDVIVGALDDDYLVDNEGKDKLHGIEGYHNLIGRAGADYFDCGEGTNVVLDFSVSENNDNAGGCEETL